MLVWQVRKLLKILPLLAVVLAGIVILSGAWFSSIASASGTEVLPDLTVDVMPELLEIKSQATFNIYVSVSEDLIEEVPGAKVTLSSDGGGSFFPAVGIADEEGFVTFAFTAPKVTAVQNVTITATVTAYGYSEGEGQTTITVNPRILITEVALASVNTESRTTSKGVVHVKDESDAVEGAEVILSSNAGGYFSPINGLTDSSGDFQFEFTSPETATMLDITITALASKDGYINGEGQTQLVVVPAPGDGVIEVFGLSLTTILLVAVPIVIIVILVILFKAGIIVYYKDGENG